MHVCTQMDCPVCWEHTSLMMSGPKELWVHAPVYARLLTCFLVHIDPWGNRNREVGLHSVFLIALWFILCFLHLRYSVLGTAYCEPTAHIEVLATLLGVPFKTTLTSVMKHSMCQKLNWLYISLAIFCLEMWLPKHINYRCTFKISVGELSREFCSEWASALMIKFLVVAIATVNKHCEVG